MRRAPLAQLVIASAGIGRWYRRPTKDATHPTRRVGRAAASPAEGRTASLVGSLYPKTRKLRSKNTCDLRSLGPATTLFGLAPIPPSGFAAGRRGRRSLRIAVLSYLIATHPTRRVIGPQPSRCGGPKFRIAQSAAPRAANRKQTVKPSPAGISSRFAQAKTSEIPLYASGRRVGNKSFLPLYPRRAVPFGTRNGQPIPL